MYYWTECDGVCFAFVLSVAYDHVMTQFFTRTGTWGRIKRVKIYPDHYFDGRLTIIRDGRTLCEQTR